jgi:hypothetical protein
MQNRDFSECLFETALALEITESQYHFSRLCGRRPSWFSATKVSSRLISTQALVTQAMNIGLRMNEQLYRRNKKNYSNSRKLFGRR